MTGNRKLIQPTVFDGVWHGITHTTRLSWYDCGMMMVITFVFLLIYTLFLTHLTKETRRSNVIRGDPAGDASLNQWPQIYPLTVRFFNGASLHPQVPHVPQTRGFSAKTAKFWMI